MRWARNVSRIMAIQSAIRAYKIEVIEAEDKRPLRGTRCKYDDIVKMVVKKWGVMEWAGFDWLRM